MENLDLTNPEHRQACVETLKHGADGQFWKLICQRLQISIDAIQRQLDAGIQGNAEEYKIHTEVLRKQKVDRLDVLDLPQELVKELDNPEHFTRESEEVYDEKGGG
jgi:hypothetical protein